MTVDSAITDLRARVGAKHGDDPGTDLALQALQEAERQVMRWLPVEARSDLVKKSTELTQTAGVNTVAATNFPSDLAVVLGVERDSYPAIEVSLEELRTAVVGKNEYFAGTDERPLWAIGNAGLEIDPDGAAGDSSVYVDYLACPSLSLGGNFTLSDMFAGEMLDVAEAIILRRRGAEWREVSMGLMAQARERIGE